MMLRMSEQVHIDRPPAEVWPHVSDLDEELRWRSPEVVELSADGDPLTPGARVEGTTRAFGQTETYVNEVTAVDPPRRLAWRGLEASGGLIGSAGSYELEPHADGTRFRLDMRYEPQDFWGRVQAPLLGVVLRRVGRRFVRQLKELAEGR
jgi:uncharacterized protein YndB with AHSA1/START domain